MKYIIGLLLIAGLAKAQPPGKLDSSCMAPWFNLHTNRYIPNTIGMDDLLNQMYNPDSVAEDTCSSNPDEIWLHHGWHILFSKALFAASPGLHFPDVPDDSAIELVDWTAIDPSFDSARQAMKAIYDSVGPFQLRRRHANSSPNFDRDFMFQFSRWTSNDSIGKYFYHYPQKGNYSWMEANIDLPGLAEVSSTNPSINIWPLPAHETLFVSGGKELSDICLLDALGRTVRSWPHQSADGDPVALDISSCLSGVYFWSLAPSCGEFLSFSNLSTSPRRSG